METIFLVCVVVGGTLLVCQFLLGLLGIGHHEIGGHEMETDAPHDFGHDAGHDASHDADHTNDSHYDHSYTAWFTGVLTFRAIVAALTFFGLAGMAATSGGLEPQLSFLIALAAGIAALFLVAVVMRSLARLRSDGTVRIDRAVGAAGTVYLSIPGRKTGMGKVHLKLQNRIVEYRAITAVDDLPTGSLVVVVAVSGPGTVEVAPASPSPSPERISHVS
jgi:membrane protein implicated in regulation of membrane protease activity